MLIRFGEKKTSSPATKFNKLLKLSMVPLCRLPQVMLLKPHAAIHSATVLEKLALSILSVNLSALAVIVSVSLLTGNYGPACLPQKKPIYVLSFALVQMTSVLHQHCARPFGIKNSSTTSAISDLSVRTAVCR